MEQNWLIPEKLCSFDEKVRVELGPQVIELDCCDENLSDAVTAPHYRRGGRDAKGRLIQFDRLNQADQKSADMSLGSVNDGEKMAVVDWRSKHVPHVWKVYQLQETDDLDGDNKPISRFILIKEIADKYAAIEFASTVVGEMK